MSEKIEVVPLGNNSMIYVFTMKDEINPNPPYQRQSDIWNLEAKQLLIDSIINGFDLPKIYFHHHSPAKRGKNGELFKYSIIDGKQRLSALWEFMENGFPLSEDFVFLENPSIELAGKKYKDLSEIDTKIKLRFDGKPLPVYLVKVDDIELIDEMFSRLNEAAPLNAPEKRRAMRGPVPRLVQDIAEHKFFENIVGFNNKRFKHLDVAAKILLLEYQGKISDTKKRHLDEFYKHKYTENEVHDLENALERAKAILSELEGIFEQKDKLLRSVGFVPQIYWLARLRLNQNGALGFNREDLLEFEEARKQNRDAAESEDEEAKINYELIEFDRLSQSPNDASSIRYRVDILDKNLK